MSPTTSLLNRVRAEFTEMPGLRLRVELRTPAPLAGRGQVPELRSRSGLRPLLEQEVKVKKRGSQYEQEAGA
jgi:hypothetical protein